MGRSIKSNIFRLFVIIIVLQTNLSEIVYKRIEFTPIKPVYPVHHTVSYKPFDPEAIEYGNGITQRLWEKQYEQCPLDLSNRNLTQAEENVVQQVSSYDFSHFPAGTKTEVYIPAIKKGQKMADHINACSYHMVLVTLPARFRPRRFLENICVINPGYCFWGTGFCKQNWITVEVDEYIEQGDCLRRVPKIDNRIKIRTNCDCKMFRKD